MILRDITHVEAEISSVCNLKCPLCFRNNGAVHFRQKFIDTDKFFGLLDQMPNLKYICFAGQLGEPTLHPDFLKIVKRLKDKYELEFFINAETHSDTFYSVLGQLVPDSFINLTIAGSTQELHEKYRVKSNLQTVLRRWKILSKSNNKVVLNWLLFKYNIGDYQKNKGLFKHKPVVTIPFQEFLDLDISEDFKHPFGFSMDAIDTSDKGVCDRTHAVISSDAEVFSCCCERWFNRDLCWQCSEKNVRTFLENKVHNLPEHGIDLVKNKELYE